MEIGKNVFVGMHSTILKVVHIGNNVIIGANPLVNKNISDNCLENYIRKKITEPDDKVLHEFFWLFIDNPEGMPEVWKNMNEFVEQ